EHYGTNRRINDTNSVRQASRNRRRVELPGRNFSCRCGARGRHLPWCDQHTEAPDAVRPRRRVRVEESGYPSATGPTWRWTQSSRPSCIWMCLGKRGQIGATSTEKSDVLLLED